MASANVLLQPNRRPSVYRDATRCFTHTYTHTHTFLSRHAKMKVGFTAQFTWNLQRNGANCLSLSVDGINIANKFRAHYVFVANSALVRHKVRPKKSVRSELQQTMTKHELETIFKTIVICSQNIRKQQVGFPIDIISIFIRLLFRKQNNNLWSESISERKI